MWHPPPACGPLQAAQLPGLEERLAEAAAALGDFMDRQAAGEAQLEALEKEVAALQQ